MSHIIICKNCKTSVAKTPNEVCIKCNSPKWGYLDVQLQNGYTYIICKSCQNMVVKTPIKSCAACNTDNWGYTAHEFANNGALRTQSLAQTIASPATTTHNSPVSHGILYKGNAIEAEGIIKKYGEKTGLHELDIAILQGQFVALMGPSGCGKSTLLKCLNGHNPATSGTVTIHGKELNAHYDQLKHAIGYVPQENIVHEELTVNASLFYAAKLRLSATLSDTVIEERISKALNSLKMNTSKIRETKIVSLSGGQKKRLCIAIELLSDPTILFLDEPTSPLDPETIEEFLRCLQDLIKERGTTVVMVTHKPEDLNYVDRVIFLGVKGYLLYDGSQKTICNYFGVNNLLEVYKKFSDESNLNDVINAYEKWTGRRQSNPIRPKPKSIQAPAKEPFARQLFWQTTRYGHIKVSDVTNLGILLAQPIIIASFLCLIFEHLQIGILFIMAVAAIWFGVSNAAKEIVSEEHIYKRERMFNLRLAPYILSKIIILSAISALQVLLFVGILALKYNVTDADDVKLVAYLHHCSFMFFLSFSATLLGLMLSSILKSVEQVMTAVPIVLMPQIMLAGVLSKITTAGQAILSFLFLGRWGTEGFCRIQDEFTPLLENDSVPKSIITVIPQMLRNGTMADSVVKNEALSVIGLYNKSLIDKHEWLSFSDSLQANILLVSALNLVILFVIYHILKQKDTIKQGKKY